jgi:cation-transporting ATPase E
MRGINMSGDRKPYFERFDPDYVSGLSAEQVAARVQQGLVNGKEELKTKSVSCIVRDNLITPFNILNVILAGLIISVGSYKNLLFMGVIVANTLIGIFQEIRAKKTIDKLSLIAAPKARVVREGRETEVPVCDLVLDDVTVLSSGKQVCADCTVLDGDCEADESLVTGESDPVPKSCGDGLLSGSFIVSGSCRARVEHIGGDNYASKITGSAKYVKKPNSEILTWTNRIIKTIGFAIIPIGLLLFYKQIYISGQEFRRAVVSTVAALIGMIPEGLVLLTSVVLAVSVIRLARHRALVQELYSIETLARVDTLCLDKTGTITEGSMQADAVVPLCGIAQKEAEEALGALVAALNEKSPTMDALRQLAPESPGWVCESRVAFSSARKWSGASFRDKGSFLLGAGEFILKDRFETIRPQVEKYAQRGQRVLLLAYSREKLDGGEVPADVSPLVLILLSDRIRKNARAVLQYFFDQGVDIRVISGDSAATVSNIAKKAGLKNAGSCVDATTLATPEDIRAAAGRYTVFGRVTPKQKLELVKALKEKGRTVAMTGDGVNDVPALKESDCSIAMASGSDAARTVSQLVLLDSDFASMPRIVAEGRRSINNLQRSASLFLVKAIFSAIIAVLFIFLRCDYPFQPIQFTLINAVTIGIPSFFLALEPNRERLRGKFIVNVLESSLPGALTMALNIVLLSAITLFLRFTNAEMSTLAVIVTGYTGLLVLFRVCYPFNAMHTSLFAVMTAVFFLSLIFFGWLFEITPVTPAMAFVLVPLILFATSLTTVIFHLIERVILKRSGTPLR